MRPAVRHQLTHLDRTLLALANERARLLIEVGSAGLDGKAGVDDLLRRNPGPLTAGGVRRLFGAIEQACLEVAHGGPPFRVETPEGRAEGAP